MTPAAAAHDLIVAGGGAPGRAVAAQLTAAGVTNALILGDLVLGDVASSVFDDDTDTWTLHSATGEMLRGRVVIAAHRPPIVPWTPDLPGRDEFRGASFPAAMWDPSFDATGRRIAVVGGDAAAGHHIARLARAASVSVFAHPPRRFVPDLPLPSTRFKRWLRRRVRPAVTGQPARPGPRPVVPAISTLTPSGIRTVDGVDHCADAIVYGTGFAIGDRTRAQNLAGAGGVTLAQAWHDGMEPYLGIAVHGFPNYFFIGGPDVEAQARYVADCIKRMRDAAASRIEVRRSSQQVFNERVCLGPARASRVSRAFELSARARSDRQTYDGPAILTIAGADHPVRVRLTGHLDPIDGHYHWQGTVFGSRLPSRLPDEALRQARTATLTVGEHSAAARIVERTPWGTHSVAGVGTPPYALSNA